MKQKISAEARYEMRLRNPEIDEILARRYWSIDNIPYNKPGDASHRRYEAEIDEIEDELTALVGDEELMVELCEDYEADDGEETRIFVKWGPSKSVQTTKMGMKAASSRSGSMRKIQRTMTD
jgi:hypothetical protein